MQYKLNYLYWYKSIENIENKNKYSKDKPKYLSSTVFPHSITQLFQQFLLAKGLGY